MVREVGDGLTGGAHLAAAARGGEQGRARGSRPGRRLRARGRPWAEMAGGLAILARLAERARSWAELVSVQAGECVCVCVFF